MSTKQFYILLILIADVVAVLLDQLIHRNLTGKSLGWAYYLYLLSINGLFITWIVFIYNK